MRSLIVAVLLLLAGCAGNPAATTSQSTSEPVRALDNGAIIPITSPMESGVPQGTVLAAIVNRTSGGIAGWSSGASGVIVFSDGIVLQFSGDPWGTAGAGSGSCSGQVQAALNHAAGFLGPNGTLDCGRDRIVASGMSAMDPNAVSAIQQWLESRVLDVPASRQGSADNCCDRVFTTRHLWLGATSSTLVDEQQSGAPAPVSEEVDILMVELDALARWQRGGA